MKPPYSYIIIALIVVSGMAGSGYIGYLTANEELVEPSGLRLKHNGYTFISPLLDYQQTSNSLLRREVREMKEEITSLIDSSVETGSITEASVYYRDLNNGPGLFINQDVYFTPASLLKVPIMIAYFKAAETHPEILDQVVDYTEALPDVPSQAYVTTKSEIQTGNSYTIADLIDRMITNSDNTAALLLQRYIDMDLQKKVYDDFDIPLPNTEDPRKPFITTQVYSGFLRILYNATYLNREYSERALEILSRSAYGDGLRAGVPAGITVSNKFGVFTKGGDLDVEIQLHDCGIVYATKTYIACVMTKGHNLEAQSALIKHISEVIYRDNDNAKTH